MEIEKKKKKLISPEVYVTSTPQESLNKRERRNNVERKLYEGKV